MLEVLARDPERPQVLHRQVDPPAPQVLAHGQARRRLVVVADGSNVASGVPTLTTSLRGMTVVDVTVDTLKIPVHSGVAGGPGPDALLALARIIASLHDDRGNVVLVDQYAIYRLGKSDASANPQFSSDWKKLVGTVVQRVG